MDFSNTDFHSTINPSALGANSNNHNDARYPFEQDAFDAAQLFPNLNPSMAMPDEQQALLPNDHCDILQNARDSAVDLSAQWALHSQIKQEQPEPFNTFFDMHSPSNPTTRSPSADDLIFSAVDSPTGFLPSDMNQINPSAFMTNSASQANSDGFTSNGASQTHSPEGPEESYLESNKALTYPMAEALVMPHAQTDSPKIHLHVDKPKCRAETQMNLKLVIDPMENADIIRFPRRLLAKPKLYATDDEVIEAESTGQVLHMDCMLICATAAETPEQADAALRRAAGKEKLYRRDQKVPLSELEKDDPAHPQNGGAVLICDGCKERERKRYLRKKKRNEDEREYNKYQDDRVIMINEKEYKKLKAVTLETPSHHFSSQARQVDFPMRITCYCRHQEEKSPMGYRVIFTFTDANGALVTQYLSEVIHITDDHKNKEVPEQAVPRQLVIPTYNMHFAPPPSVVPVIHQINLINHTMANSFGIGNYSQPPTPVMNTFPSPMSPMNTSFAQQTPGTTAPQFRHGAPAFAGASASNPPTTAAQFTRHQRGQSYYDAPMLSPTGAVPVASLPRPQSLDNFAYHYPLEAMQTADYYASAPQSAVSTPLSLSRPASPTWEAPPKKKSLRCVRFSISDNE